MFRKAKYIYTIYQEGSLTKAAQKLFVSQPCLSTAVKKTEQLIGGALFARNGNGVRLTELGVAYVRTAEQILELEDRFAEKVNDIHSLSCGTVRVGGSNYVTSYILPRIIDAFSQKYPDVTILLTEADSTKLKELMAHEELDLIVDSFDAPPANVACRPLLQEKILLAVPEVFICDGKPCPQGITPAALFSKPDSVKTLPILPAEAFQEEKFILLKPGNSMHQHAMEVFRKAGFTPKVGLFLDQLSTSYSLCAQGNGCCFVTDTVFRFHCFEDAVRLYRLEGSGQRMLGIANKNGRALTPAQKAFVETAAEAIR